MALEFTPTLAYADLVGHEVYPPLFTEDTLISLSVTGEAFEDYLKCAGFTDIDQAIQADTALTDTLAMLWVYDVSSSFSDLEGGGNIKEMSDGYVTTKFDTARPTPDKQEKYRRNVLAKLQSKAGITSAVYPPITLSKGTKYKSTHPCVENTLPPAG